MHDRLRLKHPINHANIKMHMQVQARAKSMNECNGSDVRRRLIHLCRTRTVLVQALLIYGLMIAAIMVRQYLMKRLIPQEPPQSSQDEMLEEVTETSAASSVPSVAVGHFGQAPRALPALAQRRFSKAALMGTRREMQNVMVIATILGPCRAFEPYDVR